MAFGLNVVMETNKILFNMARSGRDSLFNF